MYFEIVKYDPVNNYLLYNVSELDKLKKTLSAVDLANYIKDMESLFAFEYESVVTKKDRVSDDIHDYASLATYYWPNPKTSDNLPYIQKDGYANPDGVNYDKDKLRRLAYLTYHASILLYLTNDKKYQVLLEKQLHHFFIDPKTKMNPNLNGGQFIPGLNKGRKEGIIDYSANFTYALNLLAILDSKNLISKQLVTELKMWHQSLLDWLLTSKIGQDEGLAVNNHGTFYDLACVVIAKFVNNADVVVQFKNKFLEQRINLQIAADGSLPLELKRTKSLNYTLMGLKGLIELSYLFNYLAKDQINKAILWVIDNAYLDVWQYQQVTKFDVGIYLLFNVVINSYDSKIKVVNKDINKGDVINHTLWYLYNKEGERRNER